MARVTKQELADRVKQIAKDRAQMEANPNYNASTVRRARERMMRVDEFPSDVRAVVYEHGLEIVQEFWNHKVRSGRSITCLIDVIRTHRHSDIRKVFMAVGVRAAGSIDYLIDVVLGNDFPNGQPRFKLNKKSTQKQNPLNDDDVYWISK